jgi:DNA polymerase-4
VLKLRYSNFETITRSETREPATASVEEITARTLALLEKTEAGRRRVRLLGASLHGLVSETGAEAPSEPEAAAPPQLDLPVA